MYWIGLTGTIGSGKSTVASLLVKRGHAVLDADYFARIAIGPGTPGEERVLVEFGSQIVDERGRVDRRKLAGQVFGNPEKLQKLEAIVHPLVQAGVQAERKRLEAKGTRWAFYDVPLLFEKKLDKQFDGIVVVAADLEVCIQRALSRSHLERSEVEARLRVQLSVEEKIKRAHWVITNNDGLQELERQVDKLLLDIDRHFSK